MKWKDDLICVSMDFNVELQKREAAHVPTRPNPNYSHFPILHQTMQRSQYCKCAHLIIFCTVLQTLCPTLVCLLYTHIFIYFILHKYVKTVHQKPPCLRIMRNALNRNCSHLFTATTLLFCLLYVLLPYFT